METLVEYLTYVKGVGYLLVVAFLFAFITFWLLVHSKNKEIVKSVQVIATVWLAFGVVSAVVTNGNNANSTTAAERSEPAIAEQAPEYYSNGSPATVTSQRPEKWLGVNKTEYLAISSGSTVDFHGAMSGKIACKDCHHNSGGEVRACKDCHGAPFNPKNMSIPGLKAAVHGRCMDCHKEALSGPEGCRLCHNRNSSAAIAAPAMPHQLTWENCARCHKEGVPGGQDMKVVYHDFCVKCHTKGAAGAKAPPSDHAGRAGDTCKGCHKPTGG